MSESTEGDDQTPSSRSTTNVVIQAMCVVAVAVLALFDLRTEESVPVVVYGVLLGVAIGIEPGSLKGFFRG